MNRLIIKIILGTILSITGCVWNGTDDDPDYLPLDDQEYPFSKIPRIVIETQDFKDIRNTVDEIPAKFQIYGSTAPISEVKALHIRGRGNSSFNAMPQYSLKLEFENKEEVLGMSANKDWVLISNYADRSLLKNFITHKLSSWLNSDFSPESKFVEVYLNRQYMGVYLLSENIKVGKNRVNIPKDGKSYLLEFDKKYKENEQVIFPNTGNPIRIHYPKDLSSSQMAIVKNHLDSIHDILGDLEYENFEKYFNKDSYLKFYWVQEFSRNSDAAFKTSVYFTWQENTPIMMGPLWDFDIAYGGWEAQKDTEGWYIRYYGWNKHLFKNADFVKDVKNYWHEHRNKFLMLDDSISYYSRELSAAAKNNFKRWPILDTDENWGNLEVFDSYDDAVETLQQWIKKRIQWIDSH